MNKTCNPFTKLEQEQDKYNNWQTNLNKIEKFQTDI
jgi:hypothetical protein